MSDDFVKGFSVSSSVLGRIAKANTRSSEHTHILSGGDLRQMGVWDNFLRIKGFDVGHQDVYPALRTAEERKRALQLFWEERIDGWWHFNKDYRELGIATEEEVRTAWAEFIR